MFGIDSGELFIIAIVALLVIGPKDLPRVMRSIGNFVGKARGMAGHFRAGVDNMMREAELQDMEKLWKANNERIMRAAPPPAETDSDWGKSEDAAEPAQAALPPPPTTADPSRPKPPPGPPRRPRAKAASAVPPPTAPPTDDAA